MIAAVGSYLDVRSRGGEWLLRMEDIDTPRVVPGAADAILRTLEGFGLHWDGPVVYQSQRLDAYGAVLAGLQQRGAVFPCTCSRRELHQHARRGPGGLIYPGICRERPSHPERTPALRLQVAAQQLCIEDELQGEFCQQLDQEVGDFVLRRADGIYSYQLAVVVDDAEQRITRIVRGSDLLDSTPRQCYLQRLLGYPQPAYLHLPVAVDEAGHKLSKQTHAPPVDPQHPVPTLLAVLAFLGLVPPAAIQGAALTTVWQWALEAWSGAVLHPGRERRPPTAL